MSACLAAGCYQLATDNQCSSSSPAKPPPLPPDEKLSALALALAVHAPMNLVLQPGVPWAKLLASASALAKEKASPSLADEKAEALAEAAAMQSLGRGAQPLPFLKKSWTKAVADASAKAPAASSFFPEPAEALAEAPTGGKDRGTDSRSMLSCTSECTW
jgi:hypothetical protein